MPVFAITILTSVQTSEVPQGLSMLETLVSSILSCRYSGKVLLDLSTFPLTGVESVPNPTPVRLLYWQQVGQSAREPICKSIERNHAGIPHMQRYIGFGSHLGDVG